MECFMTGNVRTICAGFIFIACATANAGFYAGIGAGSDTADYKQISHVFELDNNGNLRFNVADLSHPSGTGVFGTLFAGFQTLYNQLYLAGEINGNLSSSSAKSANDEYVYRSFTSTNIMMKNSLGISALPGYQFNSNTLFYARLGYTNSQVKVRTSDTSLANVSNRLNGIRYGVGVKQVITERFAVRMDYSRVNYSHLQFTTFDSLSTTTKETKIRPIQQLVEFGVVVNFDA